MKAKKLAAVFLTSVLALGVLSGCGTSKSEGETKKLTKVTLNEVTHSVFYAPQYVAIEKGYFKDEGIDLKVDTGFGADKSMTALISGNADIGFMGPEASIYQYNEGNQDYAVNFAQLTQRAGNFLVGRQPEDNFKWESLKGKKILGGRAGGRPNHDVTFEHIREIYEWTSRKSLELPVFKYEEKIISAS